NILSIPHQTFFIVLPTVSLIGNLAIMYVTVRSRLLRNPCHILIALVSLGEFLHMLGQYFMVVSHSLTENHQMRQDLCGHWQVLPMMGLYFTSTLLLNIAVDRLISTQDFYTSLIKTHNTLYLSVHIALGLIVTVSLGAVAYSGTSSDLYVLCTVMAPLFNGNSTPVLLTMCTIHTLILVCYLLLFILLRKKRLSQENSKQIFRSVAIISLTMDFNKLNILMFAGILVNLICATNFFVYYSISKVYRREFDEHLI
ncbi:hypothetical protein V3C99_007261, partial [Haemonchus contortus]